MAEPVRDFAMTADHEWSVVNGDFTTVAGAVAVPQGIDIRLGMFLGECELDESVGVDYIDTIFEKGTDPLLVRALLSDAIADTPDVTNVVGADIEVDDAEREGIASYVVDTIYSEDPLSGTVETQ